VCNSACNLLLLLYILFCGEGETLHTCSSCSCAWGWGANLLRRTQVLAKFLICVKHFDLFSIIVIILMIYLNHYHTILCCVIVIEMVLGFISVFFQLYLVYTFVFD
jgi:hypothetical protein